MLNIISRQQTCFSPFLQFCLSKTDKEQYEKEERPESQQEILRRAAKDLPVYTTTTSRGKPLALPSLDLMCYLYFYINRQIFQNKTIILPDICIT